MIYDLFKEEKFVYDLKRFNRFIQTTHNPKAKIMVMNLVSELQEHATEVNTVHDTTLNGYIKPQNLRDTRIKIHDCVAEIEKIIKDSK